VDIEGKSSRANIQEVIKDVMMVVDVSGSMTGSQNSLVQTIVEVGKFPAPVFVFYIFYLLFFYVYWYIAVHQEKRNVSATVSDDSVLMWEFSPSGTGYMSDYANTLLTGLMCQKKRLGGGDRDGMVGLYPYSLT
jgi:hypothetical protein